MKVTAKDTALAVGSGDLSVLATPVMIALMEGAAMRVAATYCTLGQTTVGTKVDVVHTRATPLGVEVKGEAELIEQEGRRLVFRVRAVDEKGEIGNGTHERFIVESEKFMAKL